MRIAIIGTGLIGGSIGLALKAAPADPAHVVMFDVDRIAAETAVGRGAGDAVATSLGEAATGCDVIFLATPVGAILDSATACLQAAKPGAIITDVGSVKARLVVEMEPRMEGFPDITFIGGHPMAGSEGEGIDAARPDLFAGAWWVLTPTERAEPATYRRLHRVISGIGAKVMAMDATQHDDLMAVVSHVPQLAASALMHLASARGTKHAGALVLAAGGFRDVTRIAASNPDLWLEICFENREAILAELEQFSKEMSILDRYLRSGDSRNLRGYLAEASAARRQLGRKEVGGRLFEISLVIPDRPGVLAHVTRLIGDLAINIEDISISHSSEGGRGSLHLVIEGEEKAAKVRVALELQQYSIKSKEI